MKISERLTKIFFTNNCSWNNFKKGMKNSFSPENFSASLFSDRI